MVNRRVPSCDNALALNAPLTSPLAWAIFAVRRSLSNQGLPLPNPDRIDRASMEVHGSGVALVGENDVEPVLFGERTTAGVHSANVCSPCDSVHFFPNTTSHRMPGSSQFYLTSRSVPESIRTALGGSGSMPWD